MIINYKNIFIDFINIIIIYYNKINKYIINNLSSSWLRPLSPSPIHGILSQKISRESWNKPIYIDQSMRKLVCNHHFHQSYFGTSTSLTVGMCPSVNPMIDESEATLVFLCVLTATVVAFVSLCMVILEETWKNSPLFFCFYFSRRNFIFSFCFYQVVF